MISSLPDIVAKLEIDDFSKAFVILHAHQCNASAQRMSIEKIQESLLPTADASLPEGNMYLQAHQRSAVFSHAPLPSKRDAGTRWAVLLQRHSRLPFAPLPFTDAFIHGGDGHCPFGGPPYPLPLAARRQGKAVKEQAAEQGIAGAAGMAARGGAGGSQRSRV